MSAAPKHEKGKKGHTDTFDQFMDAWYPVQVKQRDKAGRPDIDAFEAMMQREKRDKGFFVAFGFTSDAIAEIQRHFTQTGQSDRGADSEGDSGRADRDEVGVRYPLEFSH